MKYNVGNKIIIFLLSISVACSEPIPVRNIIISKDDLPTVAVENINTTYTEEGKIKSKLQAPLLQQFDGIVEPYIDFPKGIIIILYDKDNKIETSLTANRAIYYRDKQTWEAIGNVVISNMYGRVLKTEKLYGDEKEHKIFTDKYVEITEADGSITKAYKGFESNSAFTIYQFIDVSGRITFNEEFMGGPDDSLNNQNSDVVNPEKKNLPKMKAPPTKKPE
ncbi:MAG: LPS export ABC transporter periplasmic protein LptC [Bacteroidales bacterium]